MKIYIVLLPWDYSHAEIKGVFKKHAEAVECLAMVKEEGNGEYATIVQEDAY